MYGGPFVVELQESEAFNPEPRPAPLAPGLYDHYHRYGGAVSLAFATLAGLRTGSFGRVFEAVLLLNPRTAVVGLEAANLQAATRALRAGLTVVGTRPARQIILPERRPAPRPAAAGRRARSDRRGAGGAEPRLRRAYGDRRGGQRGSRLAVGRRLSDARPGAGRGGRVHRALGHRDRRRRPLYPGPAGGRPNAPGLVRDGAPGGLPAVAVPGNRRENAGLHRLAPPPPGRHP